MASLGVIKVPVHWVPPVSAKPGDSATLQFMYSFISVIIPEGWEPGQPLLFEGAIQPQPVPVPHRPSCITCDQLCGIVTACIGVFGLIAGCVYLSSTIPGSLGFLLGFSLLLVALGLLFGFERITRRAESFSQFQAVLLAAAIAMIVLGVGVAFVQGLANTERSEVKLAVLLVWVVTHALLTAGALAYMRSLTRLGSAGRKSATSFLPWFVLVMSCILVGVMAITLVVSSDKAQISGAIAYGLALAVGSQSVSLSCLAPNFGAWLPGADPEAEQSPIPLGIALLPSVTASLVAALLLLQSLIGDEDTSPGQLHFLLREVYTVGFLSLVALGRTLNYLMYGYTLLLQLVCLVALAIIAAADEDAFIATPWLLAGLAFVAVQLASLIGGLRRPRPAAEAEAEAGSEAAEVATEEGVSFVSALGLVARGVRRSYKDCLRLAGVFLICAVATLRTSDWLGLKTPTVAHVLLLAFPACLLTVHVLLRGTKAQLFEETPSNSWDAPMVALFGMVVAALPLRALLTDFAMRNDDIGLQAGLYDASLVVYPLLIVGSSSLLFKSASAHMKHQAAASMLIASLCFFSLSACPPVALGLCGAAAFILAWSFQGATAMALAALFWVFKGLAVVDGTVDKQIVPGIVVEVLVTVVACAAVAAGILRTSKEREGNVADALPVALLCLLLPLPGVANYLSPLPMMLAMVGLELRPRWETCLTCGFVMLLGACAFFSWDLDFGALIAALAMTLAGGRFTFFAGEDRRNTAAVAWSTALFLALFGEANVLLTQCLTFLPLGVFSIALVTFPTALWGLFYVLPGLWVIQLSLHTSLEADSLVAAVVLGGLLMVLPSLAHRLPRLLKGVVVEVQAWLELAGLFWLMVGTWLGLYLRYDARQGLAIAIFMIVGMVELVLGLSFVALSHQRRIGGLLCISIGIFCGAGATGGMLQGVLMLFGSLMTIGMAVLVTLSHSAEAEVQAEDEAVADAEAEAAMEPEGDASA